MQVKETVRACRRNVNRKDTSMLPSEEVLAKIDDDLAVLSKSSKACMFDEFITKQNKSNDCLLPKQTITFVHS